MTTTQQAVDRALRSSWKRADSIHAVTVPYDATLEELANVSVSGCKTMRFFGMLRVSRRADAAPNAVEGVLNMYLSRQLGSKHIA